jgi:proliferating cell nuclear antigen PCNA
MSSHIQKTKSKKNEKNNKESETQESIGIDGTKNNIVTKRNTITTTEDNIDTTDDSNINENEFVISPQLNKKKNSNKTTINTTGDDATRDDATRDDATRDDATGDDATGDNKFLIIELLNANKIQQFKTIFQNIKNFSKEINININKDKKSFYIQCIDFSKVSVFELNLPALWFDKWFVPINCVIGISTALFNNILSLSENSIIIQYDPYIETDKLLINLKSEKCDFDYELPLMDIDIDCFEIPESEYLVDIKMKSAFFYNIIDKLKKFGGDLFDIKCDEESIKLYTNTIQSGKMTAEIKIDDLIDYSIGADKIVSSFGMSYIHNIASFYKVSEYINIHFTNDEPLKLIYKLSEDVFETTTTNNVSANISANIVFYLAPKMTDNDD